MHGIFTFTAADEPVLTWVASTDCYAVGWLKSRGRQARDNSSLDALWRIDMSGVRVRPTHPARVEGTAMKNDTSQNYWYIETQSRIRAAPRASMSRDNPSLSKYPDIILIRRSRILMKPHVMLLNAINERIFAMDVGNTWAEYSAAGMKLS